jgi:hypothetical protein
LLSISIIHYEFLVFGIKSGLALVYRRHRGLTYLLLFLMSNLLRNPPEDGLISQILPQIVEIFAANVVQVSNKQKYPIPRGMQFVVLFCIKNSF